MEPKSDLPKLPNMVMCGDHPSFTKTELNAKDTKDDKDSTPLPCTKLSPTSSRTERPAERGERQADREKRGRSDHVLRAEIVARSEPRRRTETAREQLPGNSGLVQAALGSFRWPPYLLAVWVLVLVLTHALHCVVSCLERAMPRLRQVCQYFHTWTEDIWRSETDSRRFYPAALAVFTGLLYVLYFALFALYSVAVWAIEPLCTEGETKPVVDEVMDTKVTDYVDIVKSCTSLKQ